MTEYNTYVPPKGPPNALIAIVGEQPGLQEVRRREPFIGPAGKNLDECLSAAKLPRVDCYLTNVIKDYNMAIKEYINIIYNSRTRSYSFKVSPQGEEYIQLLKEELTKVNPNVIVACGNIPLYALCSRAGITSWRGSIIESTLILGKKVIPTLHPATYTQEKLHKNPSAYLNRYLITADLAKAKEQSYFPDIRLTERNLRIKPSYIEVLEYLHECENAAQQGCILDYDIEIYNGELSCISFAFKPTEALCIPFTGPEGDYYSAEQELTILRRIGELLVNPNYRKRGQNVIFDAHFLMRKYGIRSTNLDDTMVAQKILYPEFRVGLDFITSMWTDIPYYKTDGKFWLTGRGTWERGWQYNCLDSISCADAFPRQYKEIMQKGNQDAYERQRKLIEPLSYMMERGIKVDTEGMQADYNRHEELLNEKQEELNKAAGKALNPNSHKQLCEYFYVEKGLQPYTDGEGKLTCNVDAMKRIARKGFMEASLVLEIRGLVKRKSTYLSMDKIDSDGRIRCSYNPVGTKFSRISSGENIFGTGTNLQNWPMDLRQYLIADEGYIIYCLDLSQFENRVVAYVGNIRPMIEAFEEGIDVHKLTASGVLSVIRHTEIPIDDITYEERYEYGKRPNHAFNYGYGYKSFSLKYEIPEKEGKQIYEAYHTTYPELRTGYWGYVQKCARSNRTLTNLLGRKVSFYGRYGEDLLHVMYSCIPQGTCGDVINERGINYLYYNSDIFGPAELLAQIHDEVVFQVPLSIPLTKHAEMLINLKQSLETPLQFQDRSFVPPVDLVINSNMNKDIGMEFKGRAFSEDPITLEQSIRAAVSNLVKEKG